MSINRRMLLAWAWIGGYLVALALMFGVMALIEQQVRLSINAWAKVFLALFFLTHAALAVPAWRSLRGSAYRAARVSGIPAPATVVEATWTGWRRRGGGRGVTVRSGGINSKRETAREFRIRALVRPPGAEPYEATLFAVLPIEEEPRPGQPLNVKIHPRKPQVAVLIDPPPL